MSNKDSQSINALSNGLQGILSKKVVSILLIGMIITFIIGIITSIVRLINGIPFGHDFRYYYREVNDFWTGGEIYQAGFFYLNYFYFLCAWMLLPLYISFTIHLLITFLMFYLILKHVTNEYQEWWIYGNILMVYWWGMLFNTNIWIAFAFFMFQKYRDKWYSPLILFLAFFKFTSILAFGLIYLINLIFEKKIRWKQVPILGVVIGAVAISYFTSTGINESAIAYEDLLIFLQVPHYIWWSIPILIFIEYKEYSIENVKKFWIIFCVFEIILCIIWLAFNANVLESFVS